MPVELMILGWSVVLLLVQIAVQAHLANQQNGLTYTMSPRDVEMPKGILQGRSERALWNYVETWPAFIALALGLAFTQRTGGIAETGAMLWFGARVLHPIIYLAGISVVRTLVWAASLVGLIMMLARFMGWA